MLKYLLLFAFFISSQFAFSQGFNSVSSTDGNFVVAVGNQGLVFRSSNGGSSWESFNIGSSNLNSVAVYGSLYWIVSSNGKVYKGSSAAPGTLATVNLESSALNGISFLNTDLGFLCGDNGKVYKTENGGITWTLSNSGIPAVKLNSISISNSTNIVVAGENGVIYLSSNAGASWGLSASGTTRNLVKIKYFSDGITAVGEFGALTVKTGSGAFTPVSTRTPEDIRGVSGTSVTDVHVCGGGGFIRNNKSSNSAFLNFEVNPMMANLVDICYANANTGYAVSSLNKAIIKTTNGGIKWNLTAGATLTTTFSAVYPGSSGGIGNGLYYTPLAQLTPQNRDIVYAGQGNKVYRSGNRGQSWTEIATISDGSQCHSFYVSPIDTNLMIAAMNSSNGRVMRSTNYGQTWTMVWGVGSLTSYGMPMEMDQNNPNVLYLSPDNSTLLRSTNFGANWSSITTQVFRSPCDIEVQHFNSNVIYIGDGVTSFGFGAVWKSTDGGVTWDSIRAVTGSEIPMISAAALDSNTVFHTAWSSGGVWRTLNKFQTFDLIAPTNQSWWACDIALDDPTVFVCGTLSGAVRLTYNKGDTMISLGNVGAAGEGMLYINRGILLVKGGNGLHKCNFNYNVSSTPVVVTGFENTVSANVPSQYRLHQNYPNPFNPVTVINYDIPRAGFVKISVYDNAGKQIAVPVADMLAAGSYSVKFEASSLSSGIYFYSLESEGFKFTKKMLLVK